MAADGVVIVDKPAGWTSHDVVARLRRLAAMRKVGHAGTLDPTATGVLVVGIGRATRLLGYLALDDKAYDATIRLGQSTVTDDAEGEVVETLPAAHLTSSEISEAIAGFTGRISQVPSSVSAIKVNGRRSYARVRAGEAVELPPRAVTVSAFDLIRLTRHGGFIDADVSVVCSSGTYVRALARDLGRALGVGGHLTWLRRTRVGPFGLAEALTLDELAGEFRMLPMEAAVASFVRRDVDADQARIVRHGGRLAGAGLGPGPIAVFGPNGEFLALVEESGTATRSLAVFGQ